MPKRVIDGDSLWVSEKLTNVPEKYRAEYAWILPLAQANGCFECSPMLVWRTCYSALRPEWMTPDVAAMLDAFEAAKMIFRFQRDGKTYGFFVGIQKEGRLPKPSDRVKSAKQWQSGMVPAKELAAFLGLASKKIEEDYRDEVATNSRLARRKVADKSPTGNGVGVGSGVGTGNSSGVELGQGTGYGVGAVSPPSHVVNTPSPTNSFNTSSHQDNNTNTSTHSGSIDDWDEELDGDELPVKEKEDPLYDNLTPLGFAGLFRHILRNNPNAAEPQKGWKEMWEKDFKKLRETLSVRDVLDIIVVSQIPKNQPYFVRPLKLVEKLDLLQTMVQERRDAIPALRAEFKKTVKQLEKQYSW